MRLIDMLREARTRAGMSLRTLAGHAGTSHATLVSYEAGRKVPRVDTIERILRAAGFALDVRLARRADAGDEARERKGRELWAVLELAEVLPSRKKAERLDLAYPQLPSP